MTDIVERLQGIAVPITWEAAAEIKRLLAEAEQHLRAYQQQFNEIGRLRASLQKIADDGKNCSDYCRRQARAALEPKP